MRFQPKADNVLQKEENDRREKNLLPAGDYDFEVTIGTDEVSSSGNCVALHP